MGNVFLLFSVLFVGGLMLLTAGLTRDEKDLLKIGMIISGVVVSFSFGYLMYMILDILSTASLLGM